MSNELAELLDIIQFKKKITLDEIAAAIKVSGPHLRAAKGKGGNKKLIGKIRATYADVLQNHTPSKAPDPYVQLLADNDRFFKKVIGSSLATVEFVQLSILAHLKAMVEMDADDKSKGDKKKREQIISTWGKRIAENSGLAGQMDSLKIGGKSGRGS